VSDSDVFDRLPQGVRVKIDDISRPAFHGRTGNVRLNADGKVLVEDAEGFWRTWFPRQQVVPFPEVDWREEMFTLQEVMQRMANHARANDKKSDEHFYAGAAEAYQQAVTQIQAIKDRE
jgi:hypothetical protein